MGRWLEKIYRENLRIEQEIREDTERLVGTLTRVGIGGTILLTSIAGLSQCEKERDESGSLRFEDYNRNGSYVEQAEDRDDYGLAA